MHRCHRDRTVLRRGGTRCRRPRRPLPGARPPRRRTDVPYLDQAARPHALGRPGAGLGGGLGGPAVLPPGRVRPDTEHPYNRPIMLEDLFHPLVAGWFAERFEGPTAPQRAGWREIASGRHPLIAAPTGSGKTPAA